MATDAFANPAISILASPPASPAAGTRYLVAASGTSGAFVGRENQVAERTGSTWAFSGAPLAGQQLIVGQLLLQFDGGWKLSSSNVFQTVTALLVATATYEIANGASWRCAGRTSPDDGGGCVFCYDASDTSSADNGGTIRVDADGHRLKAQVVDMMSLPWVFGMKADHFSDDSAALQAMVDWAFSQNIRDVYLPPRAIGLQSSVFIPYGIMLHGQLSSYDVTRPSSRLITISGASYTNGFMVGFNTTDNSTVSDGGNYFGGGMENVCFLDEAGLGNAKGIIAFGNNFEFRNIGGRYMLQVLKRPDYPSYWDNLHILNPYYSSPADPEFPQFEISGAGDGLIIEGGNFPPDQSFAIELVNYTRGGVVGGTIRQCINGSMYIDGTNITIENWHAENSYLRIGSEAHVVVSNSNIGENTEMTEPAVQIVGGFEGGLGNSLELNNVSFRWQGPGQFYSPALFDVSLSLYNRLVVKNCRRRVNGTDSNTCDTGIRVGRNDNTTPVPGWANHADLLSRDGEILPGYNVVLDSNIPAASGNYRAPWSASASPTAPNSWQIATGRYYYFAVRMYDAERRIGFTGVNGELNVNVTSTSALVDISAYSADHPNPGAGPVQGMTRFYRGTASGVYNAYADVPIIAPDPAGVVDDGNYIGGVRWISRTPSGIETFYPPDIRVPWHLYGANVLKNMVPVITMPGNAAVTLRVASDQQVLYSAPITANRAVTLPALGRQGDRVLVTRTAGATGAFNVTIAYGGGSTTLAAPSRVASAEFVHNGTNWVLVAQSVA